MNYLWALSILLSSMVIWWAGFGKEYWKEWGIPPGFIMLISALGWITGWMTIGRSGLWMGTNGGALVLGGMALILLLRQSRVMLTLVFLVGLIGLTILRHFLPSDSHQALVLTWLVPEAIGIGVVAGIWIGSPVSACLSSVVWVFLSSLYGLLYEHRVIGRHVFAFEVFAAVTAWSLGWAAQQLKVRRNVMTRGKV